MPAVEAPLPKPPPPVAPVATTDSGDPSFGAGIFGDLVETVAAAPPAPVDAPVTVHVNTADGTATVARCNRVVAQVESQSGLSVFFIRSVTKRTILRKNRSDLAVEINRFQGLRLRTQ